MAEGWLTGGLHGLGGVRSWLPRFGQDGHGDLALARWNPDRGRRGRCTRASWSSAESPALRRWLEEALRAPLLRAHHGDVGCASGEGRLDRVAIVAIAGGDHHVGVFVDRASVPVSRVVTVRSATGDVASILEHGHRVVAERSSAHREQGVGHRRVADHHQAGRGMRASRKT